MPQTAYFLWLNENRAALAKEAPGGVSEVAKLGGERWKALKPSDKAKFEKLAAEKKAVYDQAMKEYKEKNAGAEEDESCNVAIIDWEEEEEEDDGTRRTSEA